MLIPTRYEMHSLVLLRTAYIGVGLPVNYTSELLLSLQYKPCMRTCSSEPLHGICALHSQDVWKSPPLRDNSDVDYPPVSTIPIGSWVTFRPSKRYLQPLVTNSGPRKQCKGP
jgi:hypothetical protein